MRSIDSPNTTGAAEGLLLRTARFGPQFSNILANSKTSSVINPSITSRIASQAFVHYKIVRRQAIKLQPVLRCRGHLLAITAIGLAIGSMIVPLDAAPRRFVPVPRSRPALDARPATPSQASDQKPSHTEAAARDDAACLARLRAADIRFDIPTMRIASNAACAIEVPVRLKSITTRMRAVTEVRLPEEPVVSCEFAERLAAWLGHLVDPDVA